MPTELTFTFFTVQSLHLFFLVFSILTSLESWLANLGSGVNNVINLNPSNVVRLDFVTPSSRTSPKTTTNKPSRSPRDLYSRPKDKGAFVV